MSSTHTVALIEFASRSLPVKVHLKKKSGGRKTRRCPIGNQIPYRTPSSFFWLRFFFGVHFYRQTQGTCLHHTVLLVGVTDPGNSGAWLGWGSYFILIYMEISTFSNAHNFVKNLVWTSFYSPFWSSWADLSFAPTFRVWRQILFSASALNQVHSTSTSTRVCIFVLIII